MCDRLASVVAQKSEVGGSGGELRRGSSGWRAHKRRHRQARKGSEQLDWTLTKVIEGMLIIGADGVERVTFVFDDQSVSPYYDSASDEDDDRRRIACTRVPGGQTSD